MSIQPLPQDVVAQIKSSTTITSLNSVVCGLVKNSLDAGATRITLSLDYARGNCSAEDDGTGILPAEFSPEGGLGKLYYTSKYPAKSEVHGRTGTFLASVAALSLLSVTSHHRAHYSHNSIKIRNSEVLSRHTPSPPEQRLRSFSHGTRATVRDLFGSLPVRVKQRAALDRATTSRDWDQLKHALLALVLAWPHEVSLSVRDTVSQQSTTIRGLSRIGRELPDEQRRYEITRRISRILVQAGFSDEYSSDSWVALKAAAGHLTISGAVCVIPVATKRRQFINIGIQPLSNEHGTNILYKEINQLFSNSSFGMSEEADEASTAEAKGHAVNGRRYTNRELKCRKGVDRWPMFHLDICLDWGQMPNPSFDESLGERPESLGMIVDVLQAMISEFLKKRHFSTKHYRSRKDGFFDPAAARGDTAASGSRIISPALVLQPTSRCVTPSNRRFTSDSKSTVGDLATSSLRLHQRGETSGTESPFDTWTRIKRGRPDLSGEKGGPPHRSDSRDIYSKVENVLEHAWPNNQGGRNSPPLMDVSGNLLRAPFWDVEIPSTSATEDEEQEKHISWTNPATSKTSMVDSRTGFIIKESAKARPEQIETAPSAYLTVSKRIRLEKAGVQGEVSPWLRDILSSWTNPVFETAEARIPTAFDGAKSVCHHAASRGHCRGRHASAAGSDGTGIGCVVEARVSKHGLRGAAMIAQVDRKFILAKLPLRANESETSRPNHAPATLLVIIDQHAADERCRVEALMKDYFTTTCKSVQAEPAKARSEVLDTPLRYEVSAHECPLLERYAPHFERWGVFYRVSPAKRSALRGGTLLPRPRLNVTSLPPSIVERCRSEPRLLIELLRKEVWALVERAHAASPDKDVAVGPAPGSAPEESVHWLARLHGCPQGIINMISSRACRSAIMFNDVLSREDCTGLIRRLADCAFPFQCAHGRPSMVPLLGLGDANTKGAGGMMDEGAGSNLAHAFWKWKDTMGSKTSAS